MSILSHKCCIFEVSSAIRKIFKNNISIHDTHFSHMYFSFAYFLLIGLL